MCTATGRRNINTPLELAMLNGTSRFHLVIDVIDRVPRLRAKAAHLKEELRNAMIDNLRYAHEHGTDRARSATGRGRTDARARAVGAPHG